MVGRLRLDVARHDAGPLRLARRAALVHRVPHRDAHHRLDREPEAVEVAQGDGLDHPPARVVARRGDGDLAQVDRPIHRAEAGHHGAHLLRRLDRLALGDAERLLVVEEVHLRADDVDLRAAREHVRHLPPVGVVVAVLVVVDVQVHLRRERLLRALEGEEGVVARHRAVVAPADPVAGDEPPHAVVGRRLVAHVPALEAVAVVAADRQEAALPDLVQRLDEVGSLRLQLLHAHRLEFLLLRGIGPVAGSARAAGRLELHLLQEALHERQLGLALRVVPERGLPVVAAPAEDVAVAADALLFAERHAGVARRTAPAPVGPRLVLAVPVGRRVLVGGREAHLALLGLERTPVERDRGGVEQAVVPEHRLVARVARVGTELVEVEDVRAEHERMRQLLHPHLGIGGQALHRQVRLAVAFDLRIDAALDVVIPDRPVLVGHDRPVHREVRRRRHRRSRLRRHSGTGEAPRQNGHPPQARPRRPSIPSFRHRVFLSVVRGSCKLKFRTAARACSASVPSRRRSRRTAPRRPGAARPSRD